MTISMTDPTNAVEASMITTSPTHGNTGDEHAKPWSLSRIPGYLDAPVLESVHASGLTEEEFRRNFVGQMRPVRVIGAVRHWPAFQKWKSEEYLKQKVGPSTLIQARTHPLIEAEHNPAWLDRNKKTTTSVSFNEFLRRARDDSRKHFVMHSYPLQDSVLSPLAPDVAGFPFLRKLGGRVYPPYRAFMYGQSFTDWHYHPADETLMCQVVGDKEVALMDPGQTSWATLWPLMLEHGCTFERDVSTSLRGARLVRTKVEEGDALYIPIFWWHAVEAFASDSLGITVAVTFPSPVAFHGDIRYPAARRFMAQLLRTRRAPIAILAMGWWLASLIPAWLASRRSRLL
jgi:hypothetical protein